MHNADYYLVFSHFLGIGPYRLNKLIDYFGSIKKAYEANESDFSQAIGQSIGHRFIRFRNSFDPVKKREEIVKKKITILSREDQKYPSSLKALEDAPICLYVRGDLSCIDFENDQFFAIVGTRKPTSYGQMVTRRFASELASVGFVIVSGMAIGIDTIAHETAINGGGKTIAFLGCGVDVVYPAANRQLYERIVAAGLVISEFPPGMLVQKGLFIARNRLISGLSRGIMVAEGLKDSGSLITAKYAAEQGKTVFAPPSPITSSLSEAPNQLLKDGAKLVTTVEDILSEFNIKFRSKSMSKIQSELTNDEKDIVNYLKAEPLSLDELALKTSQPANTLLNTISLLEIKNVVMKNTEGDYELV